MEAQSLLIFALWKLVARWETSSPWCSLRRFASFSSVLARENCCLLHVSLVPRLGASGEQKTKPTQHGVKELRSAGLQPDLIVCRSEELLSKSTQEKIAMFCHVPPNNVIAVHTVSNIYHVPLILFEQKVHEIISASLGMSSDVPMPSPHLLQWKDLAETVDNAKKEVRIAIVGKYTGLTDSYLFDRQGVQACRYCNWSKARHRLGRGIDARAGWFRER